MFNDYAVHDCQKTLQDIAWEQEDLDRRVQAVRRELKDSRTFEYDVNAAIENVMLDPGEHGPVDWGGLEVAVEDIIYDYAREDYDAEEVVAEVREQYERQLGWDAS